MTDGGQRGDSLLLLGGLRSGPAEGVSADYGGVLPSQSSVSSLCSRPQDCTICMGGWSRPLATRRASPQGVCRPELVGRLGRCGHMYHLLCLVAMYSNGNKVGCGGGLAGSSRRAGEGPRHLGTSQPHPSPPQDGSLQCPTCKAIYGERTGTQPPGKMGSPHPSLAARFRLTPRPSASSRHPHRHPGEPSAP